MIEAQIANACGVQHFFLRDESTGQFKRITGPDEIEAAVCFESVVRCSEDDDSDRGPFIDC